MSGWKTWTAAIGMIAYGVGGAVAGMHDPAHAIELCLAGLATIGIGHKIEKHGVH